MTKKKDKRADKKQSKAKKLQRDKVVEEKVRELEASKGLPAPESLKIPEEHLHLLADYTGPKPKPPKKKTLYSGKTPPTPPPALLDLVHNFLKDFKYIKAAHGVRTDNQKRPGHNMSIWKWTSDGLPDLLQMFLQWREKNPGQIGALPRDDPTPKRTEGMALGLFGSETQLLSRQAYMENGSKSRLKGAGADAGAGPSSSDSDADSVSKFDSMAVDLVSPAREAKSLKRKASSSSSAASGDSDSDSDMSTDDSSNDDDDSRLIKKPRFGDARPPVLGAKKSNGVTRSSSPSESSSSESEAQEATPAASAARVPLPASSDSDDSSDSVLSSDDDSVTEAGVQTAEPGKGTTNGTAHIHAAPQSEPSDSDSDSESSTATDSPASAAPATATAPFQPDVLVYNKPLSKSAAKKVARGGAAPEREQKVVPATAQNFKKLKKERIAFSRIPADLQVDARFASNAYVPYDFAEKSHRDLVVTKGKGFTKEKNKKKRGQGFRGGLIDVDSKRGIKFDD